MSKNKVDKQNEDETKIEDEIKIKGQEKNFRMAMMYGFMFVCLMVMILSFLERNRTLAWIMGFGFLASLLTILWGDRW